MDQSTGREEGKGNKLREVSAFLYHSLTWDLLDADQGAMDRSPHMTHTSVIIIIMKSHLVIGPAHIDCCLPCTRGGGLIPSNQLTPDNPTPREIEP